MARLFFLLLTGLLVTTNAHAREFNFLWGPYLAVSNTTLKDPDGSVDNATSLSRAGFKFNYFLQRKTSINFDAYYHADSYEASTENIGQEVKGFGIFAEYIYKYPLAINYKLWFGGGFGFNSLKYSDRFTYESENYLGAKYEDEKRNDYMARLSTTLVAGSKRSFKWTVGLNYDFPINDGVQGLFLNAGLLF